MKLNELKQSLDMFVHEHEDFLHHIAEEELISCKVFEVKADGNCVAFIADCNDKPRPTGFQKDLTEKLQKRLTKHPELSHLKVKVYHKDFDPR